jgi:outer membrane cobalamin receptor
MKKIVFLIFFVFLFASDKNNFLKVLNETNDIAYENRINIDKIPANMDILKRDFIIHSGAKTLLDLLKYIPGIEISRTPSGKTQLIIRGNKSDFIDKIKLMINGIDVTNDLYNNEFYYYNLPASLIKRIEIVKTPDSILYGDNAFLGVINVVTLNELDDNMFNFYISNKNQQAVSFFNKINDNLFSDFHFSYSNPVLYSPKVYLVNMNTFTGKLLSLIHI